MSSIRDNIAAAFVTALNAGGKPTGLNVHRFRTIPIASDTLPAQVVYLVREDVKTGPGSAVGPNANATRSVTVRVETRIDAGSSTAPDVALDPYLSWCVKQVLADPTLGGIALDAVEVSTEWDAAEADKVYAGAQTDFLVRYFTSASNPDAHN